MNPGSRDTESYRKLSFWLDTVPGTLTPRAPLPGDREADVAIIGAGYTGLWTAWYLKRLAPDLDVAVLEAETAGFGASGRNGGWCSAYLSGIEGWLENPATHEAGLRLQRLMFANVAEVGRACAAAGIDAHFDHSGHVEIATSPGQRRRLDAFLAQMQAWGLGDDFLPLARDQAADRIAMAGAQGGVYTPHCAAIHPARLVRGLAAALDRAGVRIYERTPVRGWRAGVVVTDRGQVRAPRILLASEGYTSQFPGMQRKLIPVHSTMVATEPLDPGRLQELGLARRYCFNNLDHVVTYGQVTADGRIAFGCRGSYRFGSGIQCFDPADARFARVRATLARLFPALEGVRFTHAWGGCMGVTRSLRPAVCFDEGTGFGWAGGYFGNGVGATHLAGRTLADLVLGRATERTATPWVNPPRERDLRRGLWEPEPLRWLGIRARLAWMHATDRAERRDSMLAPGMNRVLETVFR